MRRWKVYHADGTTTTGRSGEVAAAPVFGVVCVQQWDAKGQRHLLSGFDWYWYDPATAQWLGGDLFGMADFAMRTGLVKAGRFVPNDVYDRILEAARDDPDFSGDGREHAPRGK
jgi:hypothetical protein